MAASTALASVVDIESFINEYFDAWQGTDEDRIMSYYADNVTVQIPGVLMQGKSALREQFVRPFITAFPGNRHVVKHWIFGRETVVVEWSFEADHKGPFAGHAATDARVEVPGCGVYEYDSAKREITSARIYFDVGTLLKQIAGQRHPHFRTEEAAAAPTGTIAEHLDLATVINVSQTVSGEMVLERLLDTLMRTAVEHAGAERALRLYRDLADRESKIRRLVDANIIGIFIWELEGRILEANDAFLAMVGYDCEDLVAGRLHWTALTPREWRDRDERLMVELKMSGSLQPFEKEYFRKDGSRVPVLIGVATFEGAGRHGVAYVLDLTERKRAQETLNRAGAELAHMSRVMH